MLSLVDIWHIASRLGRALVFNPPSLPVWAAWLTIIIRTLVVLVIFRRNLAPFLLAKITRRIRARSISPLSIKGLYFRGTGRVWRVERIGWSFHPWAESRMSVKIEGLRVEIRKPRTFIPHNHAHQQRSTAKSLMTPLIVIREALVSLKRVLKWLLMRSVLTRLRTASSSFFILAAQLFIRCLPSLTQNVDFELDSVIIAFEALSGAQVVFKGITLGTKVDFSQMEKESDVLLDPIKTGVEGGQTQSKNWNSKFRGSADRFWERIWGQTEGFAALDVAVREIVGYSFPTTLPSRQSSLSTGVKSHNSSDVASSSDPRLPTNVFFRVASSLRFMFSLQFSPKLLALQRQSLNCSLDIPGIDVSADGVQSLLDLMSQQDNLQERNESFSPRKARPWTLSPVSPPTTPILKSPTSPTSPFMTAFSQIARKRASISSPAPPVQRLREPKVQPYIAALKSIEVRFPSIKVIHSSSLDSNTFSRRTYLFSLNGLALHLGLSNAGSNPLHRKWLGSGNHSALDGSAYRLTWNVDLATVSRLPSDVLEAPVPLLTLHKLQSDFLAHQWPQTRTTAPRFLSGDPNGPFVACEMSIARFHATEQFEELRTSINSVVPATRTPRLSSESFPATSFCVPRVELRFICSDIRVCLMTCDKGLAHTLPMLILQSPGFGTSLSTSFWTESTKAARGVAAASDHSAIHMETEYQFFLQPTFVRLGSAHDSKEAIGDEWEQSLSEPLFGLDQLELSIIGDTLGHSRNAETVILDLSTSITDIRCITDGVSIDVWKVDSIAAVRTFVDAMGIQTTAVPAAPPSRTLNGLRAGVSAHFAIGCLSGVATGPDLNPSCGLELSRGLELRTGISMQYCCMQMRHSQRVKGRFAQARDREQLGLSENLLIQAMAIAKAGADPCDISALLQSRTWRTTCRTALSTRYEYGVDSDAMKDVKVGLFSIPQTVVKVRLCRRKQTSLMADLAFEETCDISANVPYLRSRLDLLNAYSVLLASRTLQLVSSRHPNTGNQREGSNIRVTFRLRVGNAHIFCYFPLQERMFIRILAASLDKSPGIIFKTDCSSIAAWVSSPEVEGKWEELSRVHGACLTVTGRSPTIKVAVAADGLRLAIPHRYVLSELILNIGIVVKALRHLRRIVQLGHYTSMQSPTAEAPKHLPMIDVHIRSVTLEAADSPFEAKLGLIWRTGFQAQKLRIERELAFEAKLRAILASGDPEANIDSLPQSDLHYHFTSKRTTSIADARNRLNMVHSNSWISSISRQKEEIGRKEDTILRQLRHDTKTVGLHVPIPIAIHTPEKAPPLFRAVINGLSVSLAPPNLPGGYKSFLAELGGMPRSMEYSLLLPMHMTCNLDAAMINIRDYHLPLLNVPFQADGPSLKFMTDLIVAEEMSSADSVEWLECPVVPHNAGIVGASAFLIQVPKTIMPVKSYANPNIKFCTTAVTEFTWGVSYNPAIQEVMRVIETLSHPPQDPSPAIGFWDKIRLVFHWRINAAFKGGAHLHFKGSRDPYHIVGVGAGFDFRWDGNVAIKVGHENVEKELIQLSSDSMVITIPDHADIYERSLIGDISSPYSERRQAPSSSQLSMSDRKICAKFSNGIRWGIGLSLERTCDSQCQTCRGDTFSRECRFFTFVPHYEVVLRSTSLANPDIKDSYAGFRSNFIHFSTSLTSPLEQGEGAKHNSFHLTPRTFAHFWSWWHLFDSALSLPIRQGSLFPESRPPSKKFGRHLATIKYRISFSPLYIAHVYKVDSGDAWAAGESHCVGVKAFLEHFQADMHQREEETTIIKREGDDPKIIRHKPFGAVDVVITGLDLRALFAVFAEPQKKSIPLKESLPGSTRFWECLEPTPLSSTWVDTDDFMEVDWIPVDNEPSLYLHEAAYCPRFVYFKRTTRTGPLQDTDEVGRSKTKFGDEDTHMCLMGTEPTAHEVQLEFGYNRLIELRTRLADSLRAHKAVNLDLPYPNLGQRPFPTRSSNATRETSITQMIALLERYTQRLSDLRVSSPSSPGENGHKASEDIYDMPADIKLPEELGDFANVYQVHCPKINLNNVTRDILQKYYLASRARRGFEYHMSARAVKFIRDQAHTTRTEPREQNPGKRRPRAGSAQAAAQAVRRMLTGDERPRQGETRHNEQRSRKLTNTDPLYGWDQGVSERKAHLCLLLKPQIVLRSERSTQSVLVLAADHVVLRNYGILDTLNADDPISGYVMQRNYASINSLQVFQPVNGSCADHLPLEVFLDFRCESRDFDRLVPQTDATLRYDKFNRLRLRNDVTTVAVSSKDGAMDMVDHLLHETDLIVIQVPRFSISADASAFASMADIVTDLLLFSDPVHKARMTQLETMLFSYDFTDLPAAAKVVADLQSRIRQLIRIEGRFTLNPNGLSTADQHDLLASKAHILTLSQELNLIFDAIRLAQDKTDDRNQEKKSALRLQVSSSEISWQMLDENRELLAKLAVRGIDYSWLSRQDSSTTSILLAVDLQAFDGSPNALWPEILAKHDEPPTHRMIRRGLFVEAQWSVLAPVGGISIYDYFEVDLHPIRLALETQLGNKLVDYLIPGRRFRRETMRSDSPTVEVLSGGSYSDPNLFAEPFSSDDATSLAPQLTVHPPREAESAPVVAPTSRQLSKRKARPNASRSFSNLRSAAAESSRSNLKGYHAPGLPKSNSSTALVDRRGSIESNDVKNPGQIPNTSTILSKVDGDASEMRQRSAQKTFVHAKIPSVHVLLSVMKGRGFLVRDARLRTHDLEWRNRTSSFEELIGQFIPSDPSLRGWVKVAWQQPVFSVGGVVKELITKTQWGRLGKSPEPEASPSRRRRNGPQSEDSSVLSSESLPPGDPFPTQTSESRPRSREAAATPPPRQRSASRSRKSSLFRRTGARKSSVDSVETTTKLKMSK